MKILSIKAMARVENPPYALLKKCVIQTYNEYLDKKITLKMYKKKSDTNYLLPRGLLQGESKLTNLNWATLKIKTKFKLKPEQIEIINEFKNYYKPLEIFGGIISSKTGTGKTIMALEIMKIIGYKTLIIVPTTYLMNQWKERIIKFTNISSNKIGTIQGAINFDYKEKDVIIGMLKSLSTIEYNKNLYNYFGLTIYDEVHRIGSKIFSEVVYKFNDSFRLGLSATPYRKDKMDNVFIYNIGKIFTKTKTNYQKLKVFSISLKIPFNSVIEQHCNSFKGKFLLQRYNKLLVDNDKRINIIVNYLIQAYFKDRIILVLSDRIELLNKIKNKLIDKGITDIGFLIGNKKEPDKTILLGTYQVAGLGVDIKELDTLFLVTPRVDIEQAVGRITRGNLNKNPIVVDFVEKNVNIIQKYWFKRFYFYKKMNAEILYREV